jgi:hypothetical protein
VVLVFFLILSKRKEMEDDDLQQYPDLSRFPEKRKQEKKYASCEHATNRLLRCTNLNKYRIKIGEECVQFCHHHVVESISKILKILLLKPLYVRFFNPDSLTSPYDTLELIPGLLDPDAD